MSEKMVVGIFGCEPDESHPRLPSHIWFDDHIHELPGCGCGKDHLIVMVEDTPRIAETILALADSLQLPSIVIKLEEVKPESISALMLDITPLVIQQDKAQNIKKEFFVPKHILDGKKRKRRR